MNVQTSALYRYRTMVVAALFTALAATTACTQTATTADNYQRTQWLERPWELQYVLYVSDRWPGEVESARRRAAKRSPTELRHEWEEIVAPTSMLPARDRWDMPGAGLSVVVIEFDRDGKVKTPHSFGAPLYGRLDHRLYVTLTPGDRITQPRFPLGEWFMGLGDVSTHWAPGLCGVKNMPSPFSRTDTGYLYGPKFETTLWSPTFGCREWAYQLGDPGRPYIDITSYYPKKADPEGPGTYVYGIMGWAGFNDTRKPIIGKHGDDWFCLHDCPNGNEPGRIPDIKAWAAKNGWTVPKRPTKSPTFPDPPARSGTYPN